MTKTTDPGAIFEDLDHNATSFTITEEHLTLLRAAYVRWEYTEFGAPAIDGKRPYGNSSVLSDIVEELGIDAMIRDHNPDMDEDALYDAVVRYADTHEEELTRLHAETGIALQIALSTGAFEVGEYVRHGYGKWTKA